MVSFIFISLASIMNALMDTFADHYSTSIFKNLNPSFWNKNESWKGDKFLGIVRLDAWHLAKYCFLGFLYFAILFYKPILGYFDFIIFWAIHFVSFELFYSYLLIKK